MNVNGDKVFTSNPVDITDNVNKRKDYILRMVKIYFDDSVEDIKITLNEHTAKVERDVIEAITDSFVNALDLV